MCRCERSRTTFLRTAVKTGCLGSVPLMSFSAFEFESHEGHPACKSLYKLSSKGSFPDQVKEDQGQDHGARSMCKTAAETEVDCISSNVSEV